MIGILIAQKAVTWRTKLLEAYIEPLKNAGVTTEEVKLYGLEHNEKGKATAAIMNEFIPELQEQLDRDGITHLLICSSDYFKRFAKVTKITALAGVPLASQYGNQVVFKGIHFGAMQHNPALLKEHNLSISAIASAYLGQSLDKAVLKDVSYPVGYEAIKKALESLSQHDTLAVDIEAFGLTLGQAGIGTISFSWDAHSAIAFAVDAESEYEVVYQDGTEDILRGRDLFNGVPFELADKSSLLHCKPLTVSKRIRRNLPVRTLLRDFFTANQGKITWLYHGIQYDVKQLVFNLFMENRLSNNKAKVDGTEIMCTNAQCTMNLAYLAYNAIPKRSLSLKELSVEFAGNYGLDVEDITTQPLAELLEYNAIDTCCTYYQYEKLLPKVRVRKQDRIYNQLMMPFSRVAIQAELTGMPINRDKVLALKQRMENAVEPLYRDLCDMECVQLWIEELKVREHKAYQASIKGKGRTLENFIAWKEPQGLFDFSTGSDRAIIWILHVHFGLDVVDTTKTGQPAIGEKTMKKHLNRLSEDSEAAQFIHKVLEHQSITKILSTFISAFLKYSYKVDGQWMLFGNFRQGTIPSGRLSSSQPNLQNIPSGSKWGKAIKECFGSTVPDKMFSGADFNALEAVTLALRTRDPNLLAIYTDGYDSHSFNTFHYWKHNKLTELAKKIEANPENKVELINSIQDDYSKLRGASKSVTFALFYEGTYITLMNNSGFQEDEAKELEAAFNDTYRVYKEYGKKVLSHGSKHGYVVLAFGLRVDTPALQGTDVDNLKSNAAKVARTVINAIGQSYGQLNQRAAIALFNRVWTSKYRYDIHPSAFIHDANYFFSVSDKSVLSWLNKHVPDVMSWAGLPELKHSTIKLGGEFEVYPTWATPQTIDDD